MIRTGAAIAATFAALSFASAADTPARVKAAGKIIIATMPNYPPISYKDPETSTLKGVDIDLGAAIAAELGVAVEWQEISFAQMLPSLQTKRVDLVMAGMSDLPSRRDLQDFVDYLSSGAQFYISARDKDSIRSEQDLCGKRVGASRSTAWPNQIAAWSDANCVGKGMTAIEVVGTEGSADARVQIKTGRLHAGVQGFETISYMQKLEPGTFLPIGRPFTNSLIGIPILKTEPALREAVQSALMRMQAKGTYDAILRKYDLLELRLTPISVNQGN